MIAFQPVDKWTDYCYVIDYGDDANFVVNDATVEQVTRIDLGPRPTPREPDTDAPEGQPKLQEYMEDWSRHNQFTTNEDATKGSSLTARGAP